MKVRGRRQLREDSGEAAFRAAEVAGAREPFDDAALYDWEYRRRRADVAFYRSLALEQGGAVLDAACGTGRVLVPLLRAGLSVVGFDRSTAMLARAADRLRRLTAPQRRRAVLLRADLRALPLAGRFAFVVAAFHSVQHLIDDDELVAFFRQVRRLLSPGGWFAFDLFCPDASFLTRSPGRTYDRTVFRHPVSRARLAYSVSHVTDRRRRTIHMRLHYQPLDEWGAPSGQSRIVRLCHRQLGSTDVTRLLRRAGLRVLRRWSNFAFGPLDDGAESEQHVYLAGV